jgi:hypothetical protein
VQDGIDADAPHHDEHCWVAWSGHGLKISAAHGGHIFICARFLG